MDGTDAPLPVDGFPKTLLAIAVAAVISDVLNLIQPSLTKFLKG